MPRKINTCVECGAPNSRGRVRCRACAYGTRRTDVARTMAPPNPSGICQCGCGQPAPIATKTVSASGVVRGHARRFCVGHNRDEPRARYTAEDRGYPGGPCWIWQRRIDKLGYGVCQSVSRGRQIGAHVVAYEATHGPVPPGLEIDHLCRNRACCNPDHLEAVPHAVNMQRGNQTKLTATQVAEIRSLAGTKSHRAIAAEYGISKTNVTAILSGRIWKES